jgi:hypothetical protein
MKMREPVEGILARRATSQKRSFVSYQNRSAPGRAAQRCQILE